MTEHFTEKAIEEVRECFSFFCPGSAALSSPAQLRCVVRALGRPLLHADSIRYFEEAEEPLDVAGVLRVLRAEEEKKVDAVGEVLAALRAAEVGGACSKPSPAPLARGHAPSARGSAHSFKELDALQPDDLARFLACTRERMSGEEISTLLLQLSLEGRPIPLRSLAHFLGRPA